MHPRLSNNKAQKIEADVEYRLKRQEKIVPMKHTKYRKKRKHWTFYLTL